jgi:hypothetical protein
MSERIHFTPNPYGGRQILVIDFSGFTNASSALPTITAAREMVARQPLESTLCLVDVTGSKFNSEVVDALKALAMHNRPYVIASALIGVSGLQRVILDGVLAFTGRTNLKAFATRDEAFAWLADRAKAAAA